MAETDDALMEKFFEGEPFTQEELTEGVRVGVKTGAITPVLCGCSTALAGTDMVLRYIKKLLPSAARRWVRCGGPRRNEVEIACEAERPAVRICIQNSSRPVCG
ncbi:MAG: hypothetical protein ACLRZH_03400 [Ruthenibacterium lactatiformans]